jgi:hypothetical protein
MPDISVYQTTCKEPVPLIIVGYGRWIKNKIIDDLLIRKCNERNHTSYYYDDNSNVHYCGVISVNIV